MINDEGIVIYDPEPRFDVKEMQNITGLAGPSSDEPATKKTTKRKSKETATGDTSKKSRMQGFTIEDKKKLAAAVKENSCIWDLSEPLHHNNSAVDLAWKKVAAELVRNVDETKKAWTSLKDSNRYRKRASNKKSGSSGGVVFQEDQDVEIIEWEFAKDLEFLPDLSKKRNTFKTITNADEETNSESNYSYLSVSNDTAIEIENFRGR